MIQAEGIFAGGAPSLQAKSITITSNGTVSVTPDASYDALKKVDVTVNVASGGGGAAPAKLTLTSRDYTGEYYGLFMVANSEGRLERLDYMRSPFTFPITIETVLGGMVVFLTSGFPGIPTYTIPTGCEADKYQNAIYALVTEPQASLRISNAD